MCAVSVNKYTWALAHALGAASNIAWAQLFLKLQISA